jgi:hypothetical protein
VVFDASSSYDASGRPLTKFAWVQLGSADAVLAAVVSAANTGNKARLVIPGAALGQVANGNYSLRVTVTNFLGLTRSGSVTFQKLGSGALPVVTVLRGLVQPFSVAEGLKVSTQIVASSVCASKNVEWAWRSWDAWSAIPAGYSRKDLVVAGPVPGGADGTARLVGLTARFAGSTEAVSINVTLLPMRSPIRAVLRGPDGDVRAARTIVLNAGSSEDPDDPGNSRPFGITWQCTRADFPTPCFEGTDFGVQRGLTWTINGSLLTPGVAHTFIGVLTKGSSRSAAASLTLKPSADAIPTGRIVRVCGAKCPHHHNANSPLALSLLLDADAAGAAAAWSSDQVDGLSSFDGKTDIVVPASSLPTSGRVSITAMLTLNRASSRTTITVPINGKPLCSKASCLAVSAVSTTFPGATFKAEALGFDDDAAEPLRWVGGVWCVWGGGGAACATQGHVQSTCIMPWDSLLPLPLPAPCRYDWGTVNGGVRKVLASGPAPAFTFTGLPVGSTTVYTCAVDVDGAQLCQGAPVTVEAAPSTFSVAEALTSLDVAQLTATGDVGVLAAGAQALQSLSAFASSSAAEGQAQEQRAQVQAAIASKTNALVGMLAGNVADYLDDPQTMQQVRHAGL